MAASKKTAGKKTKPAKPAAPKEPVEEVVDEEGEADPEGGFARVVYDPKVYGLFPLATLDALAAAKGADAKAATRTAEADAERLGVIFTGQAQFTADARLELESTRKRLDAKLDELDAKRNELAEKDRELSRLVREGEDAKLERERLANDLASKELALQARQADHLKELRLREIELNALKETLGPAALLAGEGVMELLKGLRGKPFDRQPPGLGVAPAQDASAPPAAPQAETAAETPARISYENTREWANAARVLFDKAGAVGENSRSHAVLRAVLCSAVPNGPKFPLTLQQVLATFLGEVGMEPLKALMHLTTQAYLPEAPPQDKASPGTT